MEGDVGLRLMKFRRFTVGVSQAEAAEVLGVSEFRRWRDRFSDRLGLDVPNPLDSGEKLVADHGFKS